MIETGTLLQDRYLIEKQIGAGGMGAVYLAIDQRFESPVAIKETFYKDDEFGEAFEREARLLNSLMHPVLPHVTDYFTEAHGCFLVMQFIEGEDLSEVLKRDGAFSVEDVLRWTDSLLDALEYLHSQDPPVIHRDIKPHNLKLTARGDVFLLDFGLAKLNSEDTMGGISVFGYSRTYSPLEQIQGTGTDPRSDIFALGATAYHLITGKAPLNALARAAAIVNGKYDPLQTADEVNNKISKDIANVLGIALSLNPERRFASAKAMRLALENAIISNFTETKETAPEIPLPIAAPAATIVHSAENDKFPALESFAADVAEIKPKAETAPEFIAAENAIPGEQVFAQDEFANSTAVIDAPTEVVASRYNQSPLRYVALAAVLVFSGLVIMYFIAGAQSQSPEVAGESTAVADEVSNLETQQPDMILTVPKPETSKEPVAEPVNEVVSKVKNKPVIGTESVEEKPKTENPPVVSETTVVEKPKPVARTEAPRPAQTRTPRPNNEQNRRQEVSDEVLPDIESVFTGRTNERQNRRQGQQRRGSEEVDEEDRREPRRPRRERRNQPDPPPF